MFAFLLALNQSYVKNGPANLKNMSALIRTIQSAPQEVPSLSGSTFLWSRGIRVTRYALIGLDSSFTPNVWAVVHSQLITNYSRFNTTFKDAATSIWETRGGHFPLAVPVCGFLGERCVGSPWLYTAISIGGVLFFCIVIGSLSSSMPSLRSSTNETSGPNEQKNTSSTEFVYYGGEIVVALKRSQVQKWTAAEEEEFRKMRKLDHPNLNRFIGVATFDRHAYFVWGYCERGSIMVGRSNACATSSLFQEVIEGQTLPTDTFIALCMIGDILEGLHYIHNRSFQQHGSLSSYCCLVSERFEVKIQLHGLTDFKRRTARPLNTKCMCALFVAPEHLQGNQSSLGSPAGDLYSLGVVCCTILTMKRPYASQRGEMTDQGKKSKEYSLNCQIVAKVAKGEYPPYRPLLDVDPAFDIKPEFVRTRNNIRLIGCRLLKLDLIRKCWADPEERPTVDAFRDFFLEEVMVNKSKNVLDHMVTGHFYSIDGDRLQFTLMESNAAILEEDVQQRRAALNEEKKRVDILLSKMMPPQAADLLKAGRSVPPELFEEATVFFSDIVSFTVLASKSTPLQIISFLNDVYTLTDNVLEKHDTYKVETIGDGLHVVSGIPRRNGHSHVRAIADMALEFRLAIHSLRLPHLPDQRIQMRMGIHSGPAVAGIVGAAAPRYCVFGSTVNVAAKMEAAGQAGRIHVTDATKCLLETHYPGEYLIAERGEVLLKSIGSMNTFWLVPPEEADGFQP
ncbi:Guanylate cyclase [Aphelenchoides fujianensis]|nr:Guanylate cyclase [Aphelenchoides fujianensis]